MTVRGCHSRIGGRKNHSARCDRSARSPGPGRSARFDRGRRLRDETSHPGLQGGIQTFEKNSVGKKRARGPIRPLPSLIAQRGNKAVPPRSVHQVIRDPQSHPGNLPGRTMRDSRNQAHDLSSEGRRRIPKALGFRNRWSPYPVDDTRTHRDVQEFFLDTVNLARDSLSGFIPNGARKSASSPLPKSQRSLRGRTGGRGSRANAGVCV